MQQLSGACHSAEEATRIWRRIRKPPRGVTLIETLITASLLLVAMTAAASAANQHLRLISLNRERTIAMEAAQALLESELSRGFGGVVAAYSLGSKTPLLRGTNTVLQELPFEAVSGQLFIQDADGRPNGTYVIALRVVVCWRLKGSVLGEDLNLNGVLDAGEDVNGNGLLDCPAVVESRLARN